MDNRRMNEEFRKIAEDLIQSEPELKYIRNSNVRIAYLESEHEKRSNGLAVYGQCEKISEKYKWGIPYDFTITLFIPNIAQLTKPQVRILLFHELLHIGINEDEKYSIVPHDLVDFKIIVDKYGTNWCTPAIELH